MNYKVITTRNFEKEFKQLFKKYPSLRQDFFKLETSLSEGKNFGAPIGNHAYKIRLAIKSKGKGKRGGLRVISYLETNIFITDLMNIFLISIYDKSETVSISNAELKKLIEVRNQ